MNSAIVEARGVFATYELSEGIVQALDDADLTLSSGEVLALVGESGSGKSTLARALGGALPLNAAVDAGRVTFDGEELAEMTPQRMRALCSTDIGFIEQDPVASLDPTARVGTQIRRATGISDRASVLSLLESVALSDPVRVLKAYPRELSGGMAQRVCIAMAVAREPRLLIADEPTAALDASVRNEVMTLLIDKVRRLGSTLLLLTHDLHTVRTHADRVAIMYGGRIVEIGAAELVMERPAHPYTRALLASMPAEAGLHGDIAPISGRPPTLTAPAAGCAFAERCVLATSSCFSERPHPRSFDGRTILCPIVEEDDV